MAASRSRSLSSSRANRRSTLLRSSTAIARQSLCTRTAAWTALRICSGPAVPTVAATDPSMGLMMSSVEPVPCDGSPASMIGWTFDAFGSPRSTMIAPLSESFCCSFVCDEGCKVLPVQCRSNSGHLLIPARDADSSRDLKELARRGTHDAGVVLGLDEGTCCIERSQADVSHGPQLPKLLLHGCRDVAASPKRRRCLKPTDPEECDVHGIPLLHDIRKRRVLEDHSTCFCCGHHPRKGDHHRFGTERFREPLQHLHRSQLGTRRS